MYLYLFTSTAWKFICTVCSTDMISYYVLEVFVFDNTDVYSSMLNKKDKINQV